MRPLPPETPRTFRTSTGATYLRRDEPLSLAPWARASVVATHGGDAVLVELPAEVLAQDVVAADRRARTDPHVLGAIEVGLLATDGVGPRTAYRDTARSNDAQPYALFPALRGETLAGAVAAARAGRKHAADVVATLAIEIGAALPETEALGFLRPDSIVVSETGKAHVCGPLVTHVRAMLEATRPRARPKLAYLAPECVRAGEATMDARGRLFALGLMLLELATGRAVVKEDASAAFSLAHWNLEPAAIPKGAPAELRSALWGLLQRDPDRRTQPALLIELLGPLYAPGLSVAESLGITSESAIPYL